MKTVPKLKPRPSTATEITIDATGKSLGRLASEVSLHLRGKRLPTFNPSARPSVTVHIANIQKVTMHERALAQRKWFRYSGYPGGLKERRWSSYYPDRVHILLLKVLTSMLPRNSHRSAYLKRVLFT